MSEVYFSHSKVGELLVESGFNEISWSYDLNIAVFQTFGGEVVQILSCFIDDLEVQGEVKEYEKGEQIYEFFASYFTVATQNDVANAAAGEPRFDQEPVIMHYAARGWEFAIQPTDAPSFLYGEEMVIPKWALKAHIVDRGINNEQLKQYVGEFAAQELTKLGGKFNLTGELSPVSGDPSKNPFIAPLVPKVSEPNKQTGSIEFEPIKAEEVMAGVHKFADFYSSLVPSYLEGDFADVASVTASGPAFSQPGSSPTEENEKTQKKEQTTTPGKAQREK